ncbi:MAG: septum formation protein Maf, partial [Nitrospirae bacterium]
MLRGSMHKTIILSSASPRRKELLKLTRLKFKVDAGNYEENLNLKLKPHKLARFLSKEKARRVAGKYKDAIIIAADTFIVFKNRFLGKPRSAAEAKKMLRALSGKAHSVITGFTIIDTGSNKTISRSVETKVYLKKLTAKEIDAYVGTKEPLDKAGAYAIQGLGSVIVRKIEG